MSSGAGTGLSSVDLRVIDALARLQLVLRRAGLELRLAAPSAELRELVELAGLEGVLPEATEPRRQA